MPITQDPSPFFAGYNASRAARTELKALEQETEKNSLLMDQYRSEAAAQAAAAPFEEAKLRQQYAIKEQELRQKTVASEAEEAAFIAQRVGPIVKAVRDGDIDEQSGMAMIAKLKDNLPFRVDQETLDELDAGGLSAYEMLVQQAMTLDEQNKPPPKPYAVQSGDQTVYLDPTDQQPVPGMGGPRWAPQRPPQPKTQVKVDAFGNPVAVIKTAPDGSFTVEKYPSESDALMDEPVPERNTAAIDRAVEKGTGPYNRLGEIYDNTVNSLLGRKSDAERAEARGWIRRARETVSALSRSGRPTNLQIQNATSYLADTEAFKNPETARTNLLMTVDSLEKAYNEAIANYRAAPSKTVAGRYFEQANEIREALRVLSTPLGAAKSDTPQVEDGKRPPLSSFKR